MADPFGPPSASPFSADASPFGVPSTPSRFGPAAGAAGFDDAEIPAAPSAGRPGDPFASGPFGASAHGSPFGGGRPQDPFATTPPVAAPPETRAAQSKLADDLFGGDAPFPTASPPPAMPPPPPSDSGLPPGFDTEAQSGDPFAVPHSGEMPATSIHDVPDILREQAKPEPVRATPRRRVRRPLTSILRPLVKPIAQAANAVVLVTFLGAAVVLARGGTIDDLTSGRFVEILLGVGGGLVASDAVVVRDVVVTRYPVKAAPDLVVVTGVVENRGASPLKGARVEVRFDDSERVFVGAPGKGPTPSEVREANDAIALFARPAIPDEIPAASFAPFTILASGLADGARARVRIVDDGSGDSSR